MALDSDNVTWISRGKLRYGPRTDKFGVLKEEEHYIAHVAAHFFKDPDREAAGKRHGVWTIPRHDVFSKIDQIFAHGPVTPGSTDYRMDFFGYIGIANNPPPGTPGNIAYKSTSRAYLLVLPGNKVITAYPINP